jgi:integrase
MAKYTVYKHIKHEGKWRYFRAVLATNNKLKPHSIVVSDHEVVAPDGSYCLRHRGGWIDVGNDPAETMRQRTKLMTGKSAQAPEPALGPAPHEGTPLAAALEKYLSDLEPLGRHADTISTYRRDITPFIENCEAACIENVTRQDLVDYMRWQRKQPLPRRKHSNPERTYHNRLINVRSFLNSFGLTKLFRRGEYRKRYYEKKVVAHPDHELALLYSHANAEEWFLLDYFIGTMVRDHEGYGARYSDLSGVTLIIRGKQNKTRTVEISRRLAEAINERRKGSKSEYIFPNRKGNPNTHLLRTLQNLAQRAGASFHCELHKLRKTGASRRYQAGVPLPTLMLELGHESLATTQKYLADVRREEEIKKAVADADFVPKPRLVSGTDGD